MVFEKHQRLVHGHFQHVADAFSAVEHLQRLPVIPLALAYVAGHIDVRKKVHFNLQNAVARAGLAPAALDVEAEPVLPVAARFGVGRGGKDLANQVEHAGIGGGVGARRAADGRLVDADNLIQLLFAFQPVVRAGAGMGAVQVPRQRLIDNLVDQRRLPAAGHARHAGHHAQRNAHVDTAQVVGARAAHRQISGRFAPPLRHGNMALPAEVLAGNGVRAGQDVRKRALRHEPSARLSRARADVHDVVGRIHGFFVVFDHNQRVAQIAQVFQRRQQAGVVALVQANGGLVQNIQHADQR